MIRDVIYSLPSVVWESHKNDLLAVEFPSFHLFSSKGLLSLVLECCQNCAAVFIHVCGILSLVSLSESFD